MHDGRVDGVEGALMTRLHAEVGAALRWVQQSVLGCQAMQVLLFLHSRRVYECFATSANMNGSQRDSVVLTRAGNTSSELALVCVTLAQKPEKNVSGRRNEVCYGQKKIARGRGH